MLHTWVYWALGVWCPPDCPALCWPGPTLSCQALVTVLNCPGNHGKKEQSPEVVTSPPGPAALVTSGFDEWVGRSVFLGTVIPSHSGQESFIHPYIYFLLSTCCVPGSVLGGGDQIRAKSLPVESCSPEGEIISESISKSEYGATGRDPALGNGATYQEGLCQGCHQLS